MEETPIRTPSQAWCVVASASALTIVSASLAVGHTSTDEGTSAPSVPPVTQQAKASVPLREAPELPDLPAVKSVPTERTIEVDVGDDDEPEVAEASKEESDEGEATVTVRRDDGTRIAVGEAEPEAREYHRVRYFNEKNQLTLVVASVAVGPLHQHARGRRSGRCSVARSFVGPKWLRFPLRWRLTVGRLPRGLKRRAALGAMRRARGVWNQNLNRCRVRDRSRAQFKYVGLTRRQLGRNGVNTVSFGPINRLGGACRRAVACTFTWAVNGRAVESDIFINVGRRYAAKGRPGRRVDLQSVMVHESGHTLGLGHVENRFSVMVPSIPLGSTLLRRLGRGDALVNNAVY